MRNLLLIFLSSISLAALGQADPWAESYQLEIANKPLQAAQKIEPLVRDNEFAQLRHAWLLYLGGRFDDSAAGYRHALQMNPESIDAQLGLTLPLMAQWKWKEAGDITRTVQRQAPGNYTAILRMIVINEALKDWAAMAKDASRLVALYPSDATAWVYLGRSAAASGDPARAAEAYRRVLEIFPGHKEATTYLSRK